MAAITSVSSNASPQRQAQANKPETSNETVKSSESKSSVSVPKGGSKRNEQKNHHPPILPGVLPDGRSHDPNLFFAGNGFAPQYFFDYSGAGFAGQPALSHLPWEEYNRLMTMNGPDGQPIFNGELGPVFFQAPPEFMFPNQPHFPFNGAPSMGADGQLYGPHVLHAFGHVFPPGQFIPQANGNESSGIGEAKNNPSQSSDKSYSHTNGNHTNPSSSTPSQLRATSTGTVENSVKQAPNDPKVDLKAKSPTLTQTLPPNRMLRDHTRPLETNHPLSFPRVLPPQNGFGRAGGRGQAISSNGFFDARTAGRGWAPALDTRGKGRGRGMSSLNGDGLHDIANEQNRGPRTVRSKSQQSVNSPTTDPSKQARLPETVLQGDYNSPNFPTTYTAARFFVIKSYSEDDVHKSIKYNVWASTPNGNKRLDAAFKEASQVNDGCPVFLFFSVNASGQFCGVAEMSSAVDFSKSVEYWQQDKWNGQFKVKWHIIKDVPNGQFRHILLANNENKPVTNSRDTQEVKLEQGLEMLNIFKKFSAKTSILDDFPFYDNRQKAMQEKRAKLTLQLKQKSPVPSKQMVSALQIHDRKDFNASAGQLLKDITKDERLAVLPKTNGHVENESTSNVSPAQANGSVEPSEKILTPSQSVNSKPSESRPGGAVKPEFKLAESAETELSKSLSNSLTINSKGIDTGA